MTNYKKNIKKKENEMFKKFLTLSLFTMTLSISACSNQPTVNQPEVNKMQAAKANQIYVADIGQGKTGASFSTKINFKEGFNVKANTNGAIAKISTDIAKVDAYLLELTAAPATGSDPLASVVTGGSVMNIAKTGASFTILFKNVPVSTAGKKYFVGLVAKDSANNVISKNPATDWTGASANKGLAITNGGGDVTPAGSVSVSSTYVVSSATDLTVGLSLLDAVGAQIQSAATVTNGSATLPAIAAQ